MKRTVLIARPMHSLVHKYVIGMHRQRHLVGSFSQLRVFSSATNEAKEKETTAEINKEKAAEVPGSSSQHTYQAETKSLLRIVSNALYSEREIFVRELVSNACDALEKARQRANAGKQLADPSEALEVRITVDKNQKEIIFQDGGIGMRREELAENLGTIALSGSRKYVESLQDKDSNASIIGQFGVGFYSAFMVGDKVTVESKSAVPSSDPGVACRWSSSDGAETFELVDLEPNSIARGTKVRIAVKSDALEFLDEEKLISIVKKYSNFAAFPVIVGTKRANEIDALWAKNPNEINDDEYNKFYRFAFKSAWDTPTYIHHFRADAPLDIKALLYIPSFHTERAGMNRLEPQVSLYSRKVLIEGPCRDLLPDWLRFVRGVVDSEDLPLSISREKSQDAALLRKVKDVLVRKLLRFLHEKATKDREKYLNFYTDFNVFLKEGLCSDFDRRLDIAKLLFFDSSRDVELPKPKEEENNAYDDKTKPIKSHETEKLLARLSSFDEYISRLSADDDNKIYFLQAPSREAALASPYYEPFKKTNRECLFVYNTIDDFVMSNIGKYNDRDIVHAEAYSPNISDDDDENKQEEKDSEKKEKKTRLDSAQIEALAKWMTTELPDRLTSVESTSKLTDSPAVVTDAESGAIRRMMAHASQHNAGISIPPLPPQKLLINAKHPIITSLHTLIQDLPIDSTSDQAQLARHAANQLLDNALVAAGLMDDPRSMLSRLNFFLETALSKKSN